MSLDALRCVIQEFLSSVAALFCATSYHSHAVFYRIGNRTARAARLPGRFTDVFRRSFRYSL
jgi:hypothetical protein